MENEENTNDSIPTHPRPLGFWLRAVDRLLTNEFAVAFEREGVTRRDWMLLNAVSGDVTLPDAADRLARKGKRLSRLAERGWVDQQGDGAWTLTDEGRAAKERLGDLVAEIRERVAGAVTPEEFATTMASLEAIARELGWDERTRLPRRPGFGRRGRGFGPGAGGFGPGFRGGFGPGFRGGFGPGFRGGFGPDREPQPGFGPDGELHGRDPRCHGEHPFAGGRHGHGGEHRRGHGHGHGHGHGQGHEQGQGHGHGHRHGHGHGRGKGGEHRAQRAYERGFDAGFARGREAQGA